MHEEILFFLMRLGENLHMNKDDDVSDYEKFATALYDTSANHQNIWAEFQAQRQQGAPLTEAEFYNPNRTMQTALEQEAETAAVNGEMH